MINAFSWQNSISLSALLHFVLQGQICLLFQVSLHFSLLHSNLQSWISSVAQSCPTLCSSMGCSTLGFPLHHQIPKLVQTQVHRVSNVNQLSSSVVPFSSHLQSFPASRSFLMIQFFASGGQSIGNSASASVLPMNIQNWSPLGLTGLISLQSKRFSSVFSNTTVQKHQFFGTSLFLLSNYHIHTWLLKKILARTI